MRTNHSGRQGGALVLVAAAFLLASMAATARAADVDWEALQDEAASFLSEYIQIDTTNPPGNEVAAANFLAQRFRQAGLQASVFESEPGRGSVLAKMPGKMPGTLPTSGTQRPIVLLNHLDVVAANDDDWTHPAFQGVIEDGYLYGRGAIDDKGLAVVQAMAMITMKRSGIQLDRDVLFLGTADEEKGGRLGAGWFVTEHFEELGKPEFVLNEGGTIRQRSDGRRAYEVAVAEKTPFWLRLTARGEPGHGSTPRGVSAVTRLLRALDRIRAFAPPLQVIPEVANYFRALAVLYREGPVRDRFLDLDAALADTDSRRELLSEPRDAALFHDTLSITVLSAGEKTNVVPASATAEIDCRLLPGNEPASFLAKLKSIVDDPTIEFEVLLNFPPSSSPTDTALYDAISEVAAAEQVPVVPSVLRGFTDSHYFREKGVTAYGFTPVVLTEEDEHTMHGLNERISLENLREGTRRLMAILERLGGTSNRGQ